jgi:DNA repair protein RadC
MSPLTCKESTGSTSGAAVVCVVDETRQRARYEGMATLSDAELLALLLGAGNGKPALVAAAELLEKGGGLAKLAELGPGALAELGVIGEAKALRLIAALTLGRRAHRPAPPNMPLVNSAAVVAVMGPRLRDLGHEEMWLIALDGRNRPISTRRVAQGGLHGCSVLPRDIARAALYEGATAYVLVHNHPSGDPSPSPEDLDVTRKLADAGALVGLPLVDHVIVSPCGKYCSLLDMGAIGASGYGSGGRKAGE